MGYMFRLLFESSSGPQDIDPAIPMFTALLGFRLLFESSSGPQDIDRAIPMFTALLGGSPQQCSKHWYGWIYILRA